jgi:hypothetical protein
MFSEPLATGNQDIATVGFQPDAVLLFSAMIVNDPPTTTLNSKMMVGFATGAGNPNDVVWDAHSEDGVTPTNTKTYNRAGESIAIHGASAESPNGRAEVDAWLPNGFSLNWNEVFTSNQEDVHYLALKGGSYVVGDLLTLATTGTIAETGFGFSPKAALFLSQNKAQSTVDTGQPHDELSIGAFSSTTDRGAQCVIDEDNVGTSDVGTAVDHDEVYCNLDTNTAIEGLMGIQSVDSGGFTLVMDDPDPVASFVGYVAFGADITYPGYMPTVSTDTSNYPHVAWSGSKTGGTVYYRSKAGGTWRSTVSWGTSYSGVSVDVSPANDYVALARSYVTPEAHIGYRSTSGGGVNVPQTRTWDGSAWSGETSQSTAGSPIWEFEIAWSSTASDTRIMVTLGDDGYLDAYVCTTSCSVTNNIGRVWTSSPSNPRTIFDVAYEQVSGDALLVYGVVSTDIAQDIAYKTYTSSGWSSEQYLNDTGHNLDVQYNQIRLAPKAGSDTIGMMGADGTNGDANAWIWDGSAFGNFQEITATATTDNEQVAVAYERSSGHLLAVSGVASSSNIAWAEYTTSWSSPTTFSCAADNVAYIALKPNPLPTANDIVLATSDSFSTQLNLHTCYWNGSAFAAKINQDAAIDTEFERPFDFAWESSGSKGLLVYGTTSGQITYRTFTAPSTWGAATNVAYGSNTKRWIQTRTNPIPGTSGTKILGAVMENADNDLGAFTWDGTTFTVIGDTTFSTDTNDGTLESFGLEYNPLGHQVQHTVCKNLSSSTCDASAEFTKWDGTAGYDVVSDSERGGYPTLATTYESNGDLWVAYARDVDSTTRGIYARNLDYPSGGWQAATTVDSLSGTIFTRPSIGIDKDNNVHALYVSTSGPQLYYNKRTGGSWGARSAVDTTSDNPTLMVRAPNDATYGGETGGLYWKTATSETYFFYSYIPEFGALLIPIVGILFLAWVRRRRILKGRAAKPAEPTGAGVPRS